MPDDRLPANRVAHDRMSDVALGTAAFIELLGAAVIVAIVAERIRLPAAVVLTALGVVVSSVVPVDLPFSFGPALLSIFLPPLIFEAAWNMDAGALRRMAPAIALLAVPGVLLTIGVIAGLLWACGQLPFVAALMFGTIVSATDPVAVIAVFRRLNVPRDLVTLVEGESIANDGVAIVMYAVALSFVAQPRAIDGWSETWKAIVAVIGGCALGCAAAAVIGVAIRSARDRSVELTATIVLAFASYGLASSLGASGVFATAAAGITLRAMRGQVLTAQTPQDVDRFWEVIAFIVNAVVFLSTGLLIRISRLVHEPLLLATATAAVIAARAGLTFGALRLVGATARPGWRATVLCAGMRGALSLALALGLPAAFPHRAEIVDATFAVVLVTLIVQGAAIEAILRRLPLAPASAATKEAGSAGRRRLRRR